MAGIIMLGMRFASAQLPAGSTTESKTTTISTENRNFGTLERLNLEVDPVANVRENKSWEYGPFVNYGVGVGDRSSYKFLSAGFQLGKPLTPVFHAGVLSGQFEFAGNIMPLWQAYTPAPHIENSTCTDETNGKPFTCTLLYGGGTFTGFSLTPVILRWNLLTRSRRIQPWFQAAGGFIYTTHKFPPNFLGTQTINGVQATGTRVTHTIATGAVGNEQPIQIVRETWVSSDLRVPVTIKVTDPLHGTTTTQLTGITRAEPDAALFQTPADYAVGQGRGFGRHEQ